MTRLLKFYVIVAFFVLPFTAQAQLFDPDPNDPGAQDNAEMRYALNWLFLGGGYMPPPVGWDCVVNFSTIGEVMVPHLDAYCEPDSSLLDQQRRDADEWMRRLVEHGNRIMRRR